MVGWGGGRVAMAKVLRPRRPYTNYYIKGSSGASPVQFSSPDEFFTRPRAADSEFFRFSWRKEGKKHEFAYAGKEQRIKYNM